MCKSFSPEKVIGVEEKHEWKIRKALDKEKFLLEKYLPNETFRFLFMLCIRFSECHRENYISSID
jgi:hypothetical protein